MLNLLAVLDKDKFKPRFYVSAVTDSMSLQKAKAYEESIVCYISLSPFNNLLFFLKALAITVTVKSPSP